MSEIFFRIIVFGLIFLGGISAPFSIFAQEAPATAPDSTSKRKISVRTVAINVTSLKNGKPYQDSVGFLLRKFHYWDETDTLSGFTQTLGQIGKPYRQYQYGLPTYYLSRNDYRDPLTLEPNVYLWDLSRFLPLYDTRTPYINLDFAQSANETQLLKLGFAQNITPYWNTSVYYRRRSSIGPYASFTTDHFNVVVGQHFHSYDNKFHLVIGGAYQYLNDLLNGGTLKNNNIPFSQSFQKLAQPTAFGFSGTASAPRSVRRARNLYALGSYQLRPDSSVWGLGVTGTLSYDDYWKLYIDPQVYDSALVQRALAQSYFPYPNWYQNGQELNRNDIIFRSVNKIKIGEGYFLQRIHATGGVRARLSVFGNTLIGQYEAQYQRIQVNTTGTTQGLLGLLTEQNKQTQRIHAELTLLKGLLTVENETKYAFNNLMAGEFYFKLGGVLKIGEKSFEIKDSTVIDTTNLRKSVRKPFILKGKYVPFKLEGQYTLSDQNPTLFYAFYKGTTFQGSRELVNEFLTQINIKATYSGREKVRRGFPYRPNFLAGGVWFSQVNRMIYLDTNARLIQAGSSEPYRSLGATLSGSIRFSRFYLDGNFNTQRIEARNRLERLQSSQPRWWGDIGITFENKIPKTSLTLLLSVRAHGFDGFQSYQIDPATQLFYPQSPYRIPTYARVDVIAGGRIGKRTLIFVKFIHVNENIGLAGYYTTPFYPMLGRVFSFGLNWSFYD